MAISVVHATVAAGTDAGTGEVHKAEWNAEHTYTMATNKVLGRATAGTGAVEELSVTGSGNVVLATSPALTTPNIGTPSAGTLTNCTSLPVSGITASTSTALGVGSIELGHASDTTLSRSSAGVLAVEGTTVSMNSTSATHTAGTIELGAASDTTLSRSAAGVIAVEGVAVYSNIPQNSQSAAYTTVLEDAQKHILHPSADTTARTFTIDSNANVAYPLGTAITFINQASAGTLTISITSDTMRLAGAGTTGSRTLTANGIATAIKLTSTEWIISGTNLT